MKGAGIEPTVPAGSYQGADNPQMSHIIRSNECQTRLWPQIDIPASGVFNMQKKNPLCENFRLVNVTGATSGAILSNNRQMMSAVAEWNQTFLAICFEIKKTCGR